MISTGGNYLTDKRAKAMAKNSVKIGIIMLVLWIIPVAGLALAIAGLGFGLASYANLKDDMARAGIFLNCLGICLSILNVTVSMYLFLSGDIEIPYLLEQMDLLN